MQGVVDVAAQEERGGLHGLGYLPQVVVLMELGLGVDVQVELVDGLPVVHRDGA